MAIHRIRHGDEFWRMGRKPLPARAPGAHRRDIAVEQGYLRAQRIRRGGKLLLQPQIERFTIADAAFPQLLWRIGGPAFGVIRKGKGGINVRHQPDEQTLKGMPLRRARRRGQIRPPVENMITVYGVPGWSKPSTLTK